MCTSNPQPLLLRPRQKLLASCPLRAAIQSERACCVMSMCHRVGCSYCDHGRMHCSVAVGCACAQRGCVGKLQEREYSLL
jgi:hypothetical protein